MALDGALLQHFLPLHPPLLDNPESALDKLLLLQLEEGVDLLLLLPPLILGVVLQQLLLPFHFLPPFGQPPLLLLPTLQLPQKFSSGLLLCPLLLHQLLGLYIFASVFALFLDGLRKIQHQIEVAVVVIVLLRVVYFAEGFLFCCVVDIAVEIEVALGDLKLPPSHFSNEFFVDVPEFPFGQLRRKRGTWCLVSPTSNFATSGE